MIVPNENDANLFQMPMVEKYRPMRLEEIVGNAEVISRLKVIADIGNMPNLILLGPPGIGKTCSITCLVNAHLGSYVQTAVLELNASNDRGIETIRNKIKQFANKKVSLPPSRHKIVFLDEADSMTTGAQQALRRIIEVYSSTTRFVMTCNELKKVIEPIQSRCAIVRYSKLSDKDILERLVKVCESEKITYVNSGLEAIVWTADGDLRKALNNLQATHAGFALINDDNVFKVCDQPHPILLSDLVRACLESNINTACQGIERLCKLGYSPIDIINPFYKVVLHYEPIQEHVKLEFLREIGFAQMRIEAGVQTKIQLLGLLAKLCKLMLVP